MTNEQTVTTPNGNTVTTKDVVVYEYKVSHKLITNQDGKVFSFKSDEAESEHSEWNMELVAEHTIKLCKEFGMYELEADRVIALYRPDLLA